MRQGETTPQKDTRQDTRANPARRAGVGALRLLDFVIALGRKVGGFCALLTLGWLYARVLLLGQSPRSLYPDAADPDLRQTLWVALLLVMAQGWDIPTDVVAAHWARLRRRDPSRDASSRVKPRGGGLRAAEAMVVHLGRVMDLCVAVANKLGAFAVLGLLLALAAQFATGSRARDLYPDAADPGASLLADLCVAAVVLGWWATPFEQIVAFWRRLGEPVGAPRPREAPAAVGALAPDTPG